MHHYGGAPTWRDRGTAYAKSKGGQVSSVVTLLAIIAIIVGILVWWFVIRPGPDTITVSYRGTSGSEKMEITVNNAVVLSVDAVPTTQVTNTIKIDGKNLPIKTVYVNMKQGSDLVFSQFKLGNKSILDKFVKPPGLTLDEERVSNIAKGIFQMQGVYSYTV